MSIQRVDLKVLGEVSSGRMGVRMKFLRVVYCGIRS